MNDEAETEQVAAALRDRSGLPGAQLRSAREQQQLAREDVAQRLRLPPHLVAALEEDDYEKFPAPIYVSGYLRNYARLLGIPALPLVEAYERLGAEQPPVLSDMTRRMARRSTLKVEHWAVLLGAAGLAILLLVWLLGRDAPGTGADGAPAADTVPEFPAERERPPAEEGDAAADGADAGQAVERAETPYAAAAPADPGSDVLVLHFAEDSWAEVSDAAERRLLYRIARAGDTFELRGTAPFDVLLGNAPAVRVEINGRPYNPVRGNRYKVASFKIGGATN